MKLSARWRLSQPPALLARQEVPTGIPSDTDEPPPFFVAGHLTTTVFVTAHQTVGGKEPTTVTVTTTRSRSTVRSTVTNALGEVTATAIASGEATITGTDSQTAETSAETNGAPPAASESAEQATTLPDAGDDSSNESDGSSLSGGAIAGIVIGVILFLLILAAFIFWRRRRRRTPTNAECPPSQGISDEKIVDDAPFPRWNGVATPLDSSGAAIAEVDGATAERGPSELPTSPVIRKPVGGPVLQSDPGVKATLSPNEGEERMYVNSWVSYRDGPGP